MGKGTKKTVRFFEIAIENQSDAEASSLDPDFWNNLHDRISTQSRATRSFEYYGRKHLGEARVISAQKIFYVGRARLGADWPDLYNEEGNLTPLNLGDRSIVQLVEPAYLKPVENTNLIAVVGTSGGPSNGAIERWINKAAPALHSDESYILRPYVRRDELERLAASDGATRIHLKVDAHQFGTTNPSGRLLRAMKQAQDSANGNVSVDMVVSFGNLLPDSEDARQLVRTIEEALQLGVASKVRGTVLIPNDHNEQKKEEIDFIQDRLVAREEFGGSQNEALSPEAIVSGLNRAIASFLGNSNALEAYRQGQ